ncbi:MAG: CHAT domain-containing protein [Lewinellaceae bacterium]|nr:CHAT domain-containing protein [Lewinellaceae bacterium]
MKKLLFVWLLLLPLFSAAQETEPSPEVSRSLAIGDSLLGIGNFEEALALAQATEQKVLEQAGKNSALYADCLYLLGRIGKESGDYGPAEQYLKEAASLRKDLLGEEHEEYIQALLILGANYTDMGHYKEAEPILENAVALAKRTLGPTHYRYIRGLIFQGILYETLGQYEKSERIQLDALSIVETHYSEDHEFFAILNNNLGILYAQAGRYLECEPYFLRSNTLVKELYGENHIQFAGNLFNLGFLYDNTGRYAKAEACYLQSKSIVENNLGRENFYYAGVANNLGLLYYHTNQLEDAEHYFRESIQVRSQLLGGPDPNTATTLNNLALAFEKDGRYEEALAEHRRALSMREELLGKNHPDYAQSLSNLGNLSLKMGQYTEAEARYEQADSIWRESLGGEHPHIAVNLISQGICLSKAGRPDAAEAALTQASSMQRRQLEKATRYLSESELEAYISTFHTYQDIVQTIAADNIDTRPSLAALCYDNNLFYKGFLLNEAQRMRRLVNRTPAARETFELLSSYHRRLAQEYTQPLGDRQGTNELESQINELERTLAQAVGGFEDAARQVNWQEVQRQLPPDAAAIEFLRYRQNEGLPNDSIYYAALLLRPAPALPQWIPLCEEKQLDALLQAGGVERQADINGLYVPGWGGAAPGKATLYRLLWAPMEEALDGAQAVYFSPAGRLHRLNLGAIPDEEGRMLAEQYRLVRLNSTRQLVVPHAQDSVSARALLFGGIRYDMDSTALAEAFAALPAQKSIASRGELSFESIDSTLRGGSWAYLPGTAQEVAALAKILESNGIPAEARMEYAATEAAFKQIGRGQPSPHILHLATHGYFFPDSGLPPEPAGGGGRSAFIASDHPMIRSGLILAGGNHAWQGKGPLPGQEDGILTAYEISRMNLSGTELVVLSACETGLGDIVANEGVYGLQRAFRIAGARYLLLSLWKVPDRQTTQLMEVFYKKWVEDKMPLRDAFLAAQRHLRDEGWPPYYWAGFVLLE